MGSPSSRTRSAPFRLLGCASLAAGLSAEFDSPAMPTFMRELPRVAEAYAFARGAHREQRRESDAAQFIIHPLEVASLLHNTGHREDLVAAGVLHDTVEESGATIGEIAARFGPEITRIVAAMTEDAAIADFDQRKAALRRQIADAGPDATAVYAADKVAKVRELRNRATRGEDVLDPGVESARAKLEHYQASLSMLEQITPEHPLVRQLRFELEMLDGLPPRPELIDQEA
jgi:(p)ppGpp synthase/HD superfamily hydrolase